MTLIEVTVTIAIVAVLIGAVVLGVGSLTGIKAKESVNELAGVIRSLYDTANLTGKTCRLVFELPPEKAEDGEVKYRAECAKGAITAGKNRNDELKAVNEANEHPDRLKDDPRLRRLDNDSAPTVEQLMAVEKSRIEDQTKFSNFTSEEIPERSLPPQVKLTVWTRHQREAVKSGTAFLYFFPQGFTERAQVTVRQGVNVWTLSVSPLTGKTKVVPEQLEVPRS